MAKLRELRQRRALSLRELEAASNVSYATVWRLESGRARQAHPRTIRKLARAFGVDTAELVVTVEAEDA